MKKLTLYCILLISVSLSACVNKRAQVAYLGENINDEAFIYRDKETKAAALEIDIDGLWKIYSGGSVETIDLSKPVLSGKEEGVFPLHVNNKTRSYFYLVTEEGRAILADKHLPMAGGYNFRDLGGMRNKNGKYLKWGKLIRSDDLSMLTGADLEYLSSIPVYSVIDFRSAQEVEQAKDRLPASVKLYENLNIEPGNVMSVFTFSSNDDIDYKHLMREMNRTMVTDSTCVSQYREFFRLVQNEDNIPLLYHCSAGKDRTGMASALILFALEMDEETIMKDYLLSAKYIKEKYEKQVGQNPAIEPLMTVRMEYLRAGINEIKNRYDSVENYLTDVLKVDLHKMKRIFLY